MARKPTTPEEPKHPLREATQQAFRSQNLPALPNVLDPVALHEPGESVATHAQAIKRFSILGIRTGQLTVDLIDDGNAKGIGIRVVFPQGRRPTAEEKEIIHRHIKGGEDEQTGFHFDSTNKIWRKAILQRGEKLKEVPPTRAVAIRLDAERRVKKLAEALTQYQADPVGYAERLRWERDQAGERYRR